MTSQSSSQSREETPLGGPGDGARAEFETNKDFIEHASLPDAVRRVFHETRTILNEHGRVCDGELRVVE